MADSNQIVRFGNGLVDAAKSLKIDPDKFINIDTDQIAIRYKSMPPIVIASRLKTMRDDLQDQEAKNKLNGLIAELETAYNYGITVGKSELIHLASVQSTNTLRACLGVYHLYSFDGKAVCDFTMIDITQQRTVDKNTMGLGGVLTLALGMFIPIVGPFVAAGGALAMLGSLNESIKNTTTKEQAEILMLKTLEHYGLIRLLGNNQIQLVN